MCIGIQDNISGVKLITARLKQKAGERKVKEFGWLVPQSSRLRPEARLQTHKARSPRELLRRLYRSSARSTRAPLKKRRKNKILISTSKGSRRRLLLAGLQERSK